MRLPKKVAADPRVDAVQAILDRAPEKLWPGSERQVPVLDADAVLMKAIRHLDATRRLVRGLETIDKHLAGEKKGLDASGASLPAGGPRMSRLLMVTRGGSERFYRQVDRLLGTHGSRLGACVLDASSASLEAALDAKTGATIQAVLVTDREGLVQLLLDLALPK